jgi:tape measure domain-containing protein
MAGYFSITAAKGFLDQVIQVRGEFQQLDIALQTMLQSKSKADKLMSEVVEMAAKTPFSLTELGQGAKRLLAFKEPADQVTESLRRLGDLAAGASVPVTDLIQAYGKVSAKGKMQAEELNQFAERGIPIISELAKVVGATDKEIYKMAEQGQIGFEELQAAIKNMTNEGGQFFNLMEKQSGSLTGQVSNLGDAWDRMLNEVGESSEGMIYAGIGGLKTLVENYETIIDVLKVLIATYGAYKAVVVLTWAAQKAMALGQTIRSLQLLTKGINSATRAQVAFNTAAKMNPWGLLAAGIMAVVTILPLFKKEQEEAIDLTKEATEQFGKEKKSAETLFEQLKQTNSGSEKRAKLLKEINSQYGTNLRNLQDEKLFLNQIEEARQGVIDGLKEEMILKAERARIEDNLSRQQVQKGLVSMTEAEIENLEQLGSKAGADAARERLEGQKQTLLNLQAELKEITKDTAGQLEELFGSEDGNEGGGGKVAKFDVEAFEKSLSEQKKAYEEYFGALRTARKEDVAAIKEHNSQLLDQGQSLEDFLLKQLEAYADNVQAKMAIYQMAAAEGLTLDARQAVPDELKSSWAKVGTPAVPDSKDLANLDAYKRKWEEAGQALQSALDLQRMDEFGQNAIQIAYIMQDIANAVGGIDAELGNVMMTIADTVGSAGNMAKMAASGDYLGAASAGAQRLTDFTLSLINASKERKAAEEAFYHSVNALQNQYNLSLNEQLRLQTELNESIFLTDHVGRMSDAAEAYKDATQGYQEAMNDLSEKGTVQVGTKDVTDWSKVAGGAALGPAGAILGGLFGKKEEKVMANLLSQHEKLTDETGKLDIDYANTLIEQGLLNEETENLLQNTIDWQTKMEEAEQQMKQVSQELVGMMGDDLKNALVTAFEEGTDAAAAFGDSVEEILENMIAGEVVNQVMGPLLNQFGEDFEQAYAGGGYQSALGLIGDFTKDAAGKVTDVSKLLEEAQKAAKEEGFSIFDGSASEDPLTGAVKGVSEETASLIGGQMNAIRINQAESLRIMNESIRYQSEIAANTRYNKHLESIDNKLNVLKSKNNSDPLKAKGL